MKRVENFKVMSSDMLTSIEGGKAVYYGNGLYCDPKKGCWVNWSEAITIIANNSVANLLTRGNAGWNSGGPL